MWLEPLVAMGGRFQHLSLAPCVGGPCFLAWGVFYFCVCTRAYYLCGVVNCPLLRLLLLLLHLPAALHCIDSRASPIL